MLKIRLARHGRKKLPFYRIVLTEHTKPAQSGYKLVLWWFNPLSHTMEANVEAIKEWISKWAQPTERVAKLLFADTKDNFFKNYFVERESTKWKEIEAKKKADAETKVQEAKEKQEAAKAALAQEDDIKLDSTVEQEVIEEKQDIVEEKTEVVEENSTEINETKEEPKEEINEESNEEKIETVDGNVNDTKENTAQ